MNILRDAAKKAGTMPLESPSLAGVVDPDEPPTSPSRVATLSTGSKSPSMAAEEPTHSSSWSKRWLHVDKWFGGSSGSSKTPATSAIHGSPPSPKSQKDAAGRAMHGQDVWSKGTGVTCFKGGRYDKVDPDAETKSVHAIVADASDQAEDQGAASPQGPR